MTPLHLLHALVPVLLLVTSRDVSAVGRRGPSMVPSLGSEAPRSGVAANTANQGPSPAELEEQEEDSSLDQGLDQEASAPHPPAQMLTQTPAEVAAPAAAAASHETSLQSMYSTPASSLQGTRAEMPSRQFLSSRQTSGQQQEALPELPPMMTNSEANEEVMSQVVQPAMGAQPAQDGAQAIPTGRKVDLELSALSAAAASIPSSGVRPEDALKALPIPVPSASSSAAAALFPSSLPQSMARPLSGSVGGSLFAEPKALHNSCHPPCIQGRGICNDNLCFCKTPFTGTTCQHKMSNYARIKYPMLVAASLVCVVFGLLFSQVLHGFVTRRIEKRLVWLGDGVVKQEVWMPPDNTKKKGAA